MLVIGTWAQVETPKLFGQAVDQWVFDVYEPYTYKGMPYRLLPPIDYDSTVNYPIIVALHGAGGRGTENINNLSRKNVR